MGAMEVTLTARIRRGIKAWASSLESIDGMAYGLPGSLYG
jgi:hypothetical protein